ncbi:MAG: hypothetical protein FWD17_12930 [Polyangiaceae bacterium]|nr:hypothetical protein [Polyangiaceae bacterium]
MSVIALSVGLSSPALAQQQAQGFAVDRLYLSPPGGGFFVMDSLDMHGGLGGAVSLTAGYAKNPLRIGGAQSSPVVSDLATADFAVAVTYDRWRVYVNLDAPLVIEGQSPAVGQLKFNGPSVTPGSHPDTLSDARIGVDVRLLGDPGSAFRFGTSAQLFVPNGDRADYDTDGTYRAMFRALFAGDTRLVTYAAQIGVHVRGVSNPAAPQSPAGSELLFGAAAGAKLPVFQGAEAVVVGPEIFGATAFRSVFGGTTTALEALVTGRLEGARDAGMNWRIKLGAGGGLHPDFGAPEWRLVLGIELSGHNESE